MARAPSEGRAAGALLTVILRRFKTGAPGGRQRLHGTRPHWPVVARCSRLPGTQTRRRRRGPEGLRAARGAQARDGSCVDADQLGRELRRAPISAASHSNGLTPAGNRRPARSRALEDVKKVITCPTTDVVNGYAVAVCAGQRATVQGFG